MAVESATLADAVRNGLDLSSNAFLLIHGWTAGPLLLEFVAAFLRPLSARPMTPAELAKECRAAEGPVAVMLRACCILGYLQRHSQTGVYSVVQSTELDELEAYLKPTSSTAKALKGIYSSAAPPFKVTSQEASYCLRVWAVQRAIWKRSKSKALELLLDGAVLAPLLTSLTYAARWNEEGNEIGEEGASTETFDCSEVEPESRVVLASILEELGVGTMSPQGIVTASGKGSLALQRCYSYYVPMSYAPMLAQFHRVLFEDAGWGFVGEGHDADTEIHVERTLNVIGSGTQHQTFFKDLLRHVEPLFAGDDFSSQPAFVIDTGSGDGRLLARIYEHVKASTRRGEKLSEYPLTMVGVDMNEESRRATAINLSKRAIPHIVLHGDIGRPAEIMAALQRKKVDLARALHVRSFLDHDRPYIEPKSVFQGTAVGEFAKAQLSDIVHLDKSGQWISPLEMFASLVEHFRRWSDALEGSLGLCVLEATALDVPTTQRFLNDCVSFHFDIVQCLSRQYATSASSFCLAAGMVGLFPANIKTVQTYPEQGRYIRVLGQHLVRKPYTIRLAELSDLPRLERLDALAWGEKLRAPTDVLRTRLQTSPTTNLVCEMDGKVVGVLYMQRVDSLDVVDVHRNLEMSAAHAPAGRIMQLLAIAVDPEVGKRGIGGDLRAFALHLARLDPDIDSVMGVTRARDFKGFRGSMQAYVDRHLAGELSDPILGFHTSFGAQVVRIVPGFRPEDTENHGIGVLIEYKVADLIEGGSSASIGRGDDGRTGVVPSIELVAAVMDEVGYALDRANPGRGFFDYGMDSIELVRIRNKLSARLSTELPATLLLDFPTAKDLAAQLDRDRSIGGSVVAVTEPRLMWDDLGVRELLDIQDRSKRVYALPQYQKRFMELAKRCYPDMMKYILAVESILVEVEGAIFHDFGLIDEMSWSTVQDGRSQLVSCMMKHWVEVPQIRARSLEILHLTKQDQVWDS